MVPEVLIVGDPQHQATLAQRIGGLGYEVASCAPDEVNERLAHGPAPSAVVVCTADTDAAVMMAQLRRIPQGAAVPVTLYGRLGGEIRDLADVLDLGADHFLEEPVPDEQLVAALEALAGPPARPPPASTPPPPETEQPDAATGSYEAWPSRTEVIDEPEGGAARSRTAAERSGSGRANDPVIGQLHRTLDMLEERLRGRDEVGRHEDGDDVDLSSLGLDALPAVEADAGEVLDPAESQERMEVARLQSQRLSPPAVVRTPRAPVGPRENTVLLENAGSGTSTGKEPRGAPPWRDAMPPAGSALALQRGAAQPTPTIHDRPRRAAPLPVDREGSLAVIEVPRLVWKLHRAGFSGRLSLIRGRVEKRLWFEGGNVVFARSNVGHDRLIDGLLRRGLLSRAQYDTARRLAAKEPRRAGQLLVEAGFLKPGELHRVIRDHLMRIVDSTFPWNEGTWRLEANTGCHEAVLLDAPTPLVIAEGIRNRMETPQLWALLGGPRQHPRLREDAIEEGGGRTAFVDALRMSPSEEAWLDKLDGKASLQRLSDDPVVDELELLGLVYLLHVLELVDLVGEPEPEPLGDHDPADVDRHRIGDRLRVARESDYFELLGLPRDASRSDVRRAHLELSTTFATENIEPSVREQLRAELDELRTALDEARTVLEDDALRSAYLAHLEDG